jgi:nucleoside triphosphate pyrophosphatase
MTQLVLASASPRRRELLARLGLPFAVRPVAVDEDFGSLRDPQIAARRLARVKAEAARLHDEHAPILAADTIVALDGRMLAKPADAEDARQMLRSLRGRTHDVVTAVALLPHKHRGIIARNPITHVTMRDYSEAEIEASIIAGTPFDKAGGYAIQDEALHPVASYDGCYCNVIGLSLWATVDVLRKGGIRVQTALEAFLPQCAACPFARPELLRA